MLAALNIALRLLVKEGTFVAKVFRGKDIGLLLHQIKMLFKEVYCAKPKSSRNSSPEGFVVAKGFIGIVTNPLADKPLLSLFSSKLNVWDAVTTLNHMKTFQSIYLNEEEEDKLGEPIPFVACGKDKDFDSDMNYPLSTVVTTETYQYFAPRQMPIDPPYKAYLEKRNELNNNQ